MSTQKILVTSALPYANGPIHLGHLSGAYLPADIYVRYKRLKGDDIIFICGSDEHGVPITITADKEGVKPQVIIDRYHEINKKAFEQFGMSFDNYSRTSLPVHHETAKEFFLEFFNRGILIEKKSNQFYDDRVKMFLPDRYVEGTCPRCGNEQARSDECENCGSLYDPSELLNPKSKITGETPSLKETSHYFFPLGKYQPALEKYVNEMNEKYGWKDNVLQYCRSWFKDGLKDRAITRDLDWGIKVPVDPPAGRAGSASGKVIYVWFEAVLGYISSTKEYSQKQNKPDLWKKYWQDPKTKYVAFIGKDNVVFHTIIFPAILMAWNESGKEQYCLPQNVPANEFLNFEGKKFSKSRGWGIDVIDFLKIFDTDPLRYTLAANLPETRDTDFYWKEFQARNNNELANILGNFVNRTLTFIHKNFEGKIPGRVMGLGDYEIINSTDSEMLKTLANYPIKVSKLIEKYKIKDATLEIMNLARKANQYFDVSKPWETYNSNREQCEITLYICVHTIYTLAHLFEPVIPFTSQKIFNILNVKKTSWNNCGNPIMQAGKKMNSANILFPKIEDEIIEKQMEKLETTKTPEPKPEEQISYDEFMKVQLKIAEVIEAEKVEKSEKLLKLKVRLNNQERQIIASIAKSYTPEEISGKKVVIVANLKPAKLMGLLSEGMILAVENSEGNLEILTVADSVKDGTRVK